MGGVPGSVFHRGPGPLECSWSAVHPSPCLGTSAPSSQVIRLLRVPCTRSQTCVLAVQSFNEAKLNVKRTVL